VADHARSDDPAVQAQLDRFAQLSPGRDILGLERIRVLLAAIGDPHLALPPVFHVAGTNGKGSTCTFLRTMLESAGLRVHAYTSPHLVRFNERIRIAGRLIEDAALAPLLAEVLDAAEREDIGPSFFEATTAAAFLAFARTPADACVVEVGLGGRLDATNVIAEPLVCGIAQLGLDHEGFLLDPANGPDFAPLERIGFEKAGIAKASAPLVTMDYPPEVALRIADVASAARTTVLARADAWDCAVEAGQLLYQDEAGAITLPLPTLEGTHQAENAALAVAMLRHQQRLNVPLEAMRHGISIAHWPARLQRLLAGPIRAMAPTDAEVWLDGGHNPNAAEMLARFFSKDAPTRGKVDIVIAMLANKDAAGFLHILAPMLNSVTAVPIPGHDCHSPEDLCDMARAAGIAQTHTAPTVTDALTHLATRGACARIAILGSLYLAGVVLRENNQLPD
jgi:dihydrofolate synthase/folylpolyglutamate synthase